MRVLFTILLVLFSFGAFAQKQATYWYFGDEAGLEFTPDGPVALTDGALRTTEGCSTISDQEGNLLFYTDGSSVWNREHWVMPNGKRLAGTFSSTQSALIIPLPNNNDIFYIFTVAREGRFDGFRYSVVDLSLDNGLGEVTEKNISLYTPTTEKLTAVHHANGTDIWVISHQWESNVFHCYLIREAGLDLNPVISRAGLRHEGGVFTSASNAIGQMKVSPNGKKIALNILDAGIVETFDFDPSTGKVSNPLGIPVALKDNFRLYGLEFSPNSKVLYVAENTTGPELIDQERIYQYNLSLPRDKIQSSVVALGSFTKAGALQLAPDGKIYITELAKTTLSRIDNPNIVGIDATVVKEAISLEGKKNVFGLPGFIQSYFIPDPPVLVMPNVFTPNGDVANETFKPIKIKGVDQIILNIYNRLGKAMYSTSDYSLFVKGWDGLGASTGVYYWVVHFQGENGFLGKQNGWLNLMR